MEQINNARGYRRAIQLCKLLSQIAESVLQWAQKSASIT